MTPDPLKPISANEFDYWNALHLLDRAGFGGTPEEAQILVAQGPEKAVDQLLTGAMRFRIDEAESAFQPEIMRPFTEAEVKKVNEARKDGNEIYLARHRKRVQTRQSRDRKQLAAIRRWWLARMIETPSPLQEKMTLFWHGHFATGYRTIENSWPMYAQNSMFRRFAVGNFRDLLGRIIRDPAMLRYLDNNRNRKNSPNENLARELMELFVLGEGNAYEEKDIKEAARALTGYTFKHNEFVFNENLHDGEPKRILGRSGRFDGDDLVQVLLGRPEAANFLCTKLVRFFVDDRPGEPTPETRQVIRGLTRTMIRSKYQVSDVLRQLFLSRFFHDQTNHANVIKSPIQLIVQGIRTLGLPPRDLDSLLDASRLMGQDLMQPPSVKGWDGGSSWINTATLFARQNLMVYLLTGRRPDGSTWARNDVPYDATRLITHLPAEDRQNPEAVTDYLLRLNLGTKPLAERREILKAFMTETGNRVDNDRLIACLALITAMPEYQLC